MIEVNAFYINAYNFFIVLNQNVDMIMEELKIDLSLGQYTLLKFISTRKDNRISQKQLDEWSCLRRASISQHLKAMVQKGYIIHQFISDDNRSKEIVLTEKAIQCVKQIDSKMAEWLLHGMTEKEVCFYTKALESAKQIMESAECVP